MSSLISTSLLLHSPFPLPLFFLTCYGSPLRIFTVAVSKSPQCLSRAESVSPRGSSKWKLKGVLRRLSWLMCPHFSFISLIPDCRVMPPLRWSFSPIKEIIKKNFPLSLNLLLTYSAIDFQISSVCFFLLNFFSPPSLFFFSLFFSVLVMSLISASLGRVVFLTFLFTF